MITTLLDADTNEWIEDCKRQDRFMDHRRSYPRFFRIWDNLKFKFDTNLIWIVNHTICRMFGCDIRTEDWFGPDSGGMTWWCNRCGQGGRHIFY